MSGLRAITLRLDSADYDRLETEAAHLGVAPAVLARMYIRARLKGRETDPDERRQAAFDALERLAKLGPELPLVDAVLTARESREELEARPNL